MITREQLFKEVAEPTLDAIYSLLKTKGNEYAKTGAFHNFYKAVNKSRTAENPIQALEGMKLKHDVSSDDLLDDYDKNFQLVKEGNEIHTLDNIPTKEYIDEKFNDILVYTILQKGLLYELYDYYKEKDSVSVLDNLTDNSEEK